MKIKHWQGYGTVTAKKVSLEKQENGHRVIRILVSGNHECGIECNDNYTLTNWLLKRFDKDAKGLQKHHLSLIRIRCHKQNRYMRIHHRISYLRKDALCHT